MAYLALAYPELKTEDYNWIQSFRKDNDELYFKVVAPHFTIVFPTFNKSEDEFIKSVEEKSMALKRITFAIRCSVINKDALNDYWHVFLTPDEGNSEIIKLHDMLYSGELSDNLLLEIPFIPHIGIGNSKDKWICKKLIDDINERGINIKGSITQLDIVSYVDNEVKTIKKIELLK